MKQVACFVFLCLVLVAAPLSAADIQVHPDIEEALNHLYNFDFQGAHAALDRHISLFPEDPMGPAMRASVLLFTELDRMSILEAEFFEEDKRIADKKGMEPDPALRERLMANLDQVETIANERLKANPRDTNALFALCMKEGVLTDYKALVEKKQFGSLSNVRASNEHANTLLEVEPTFYDAYLTTGVNEYIVGSLPFFVRWFVRMDNVKGSKDEAVNRLEMVAQKGYYLGPFARILLAIIHLREHRPEQSRELLAGLTREFPENPLLKKELAKVTEQLSTGQLQPSGQR